MEEKKVKMSLGTAICIIIIVLLIATLIGVYVYTNKKSKNNNNTINSDTEIEAVNKEENEATNSKDRSGSDNKNQKSESITLKENKIYEASISYTTGTDLKRKMEIELQKGKIQFSNGKFIAEFYDYTVNGDYTIDNQNIVKCNFKKYSYDDGTGHTGGMSLENEKWFVKFKILDNKTIMVDDVNFGTGESEITNCLHETFVIGREYKLDEYDEKSVLGKWNSKYYYNEDEDELSDYLRAIFGTSVKYGSSFEFLSNNKFKDYVYPTTEGDTYRNGTYKYDGAGKISLTYDDGTAHKAEIIIIDKSNILYQDESNKIILSK